MADVVHDARQEFWKPPTGFDPAIGAERSAFPAQTLAETCRSCGSEFMIGAKFCHTCGLVRPLVGEHRAISDSDAAAMAQLWSRNVAWLGAAGDSAANAWRRIEFPAWLQYLHFHEIKRWVGLPTAALVAFMIGLGCVSGALAVSFFYKASNLAEFQAIQMWRIEWLLAATASFVAGILLKKPSE